MKKIYIIIAVVFFAIIGWYAYKTWQKGQSLNFNKNNDMPIQNTISQEQAITIATQDAGGFLGTWVAVELKQDGWHVSAHSKSARPPALYIIDSKNGKILYKDLNNDQTKNRDVKSQ